MQAWVVEAGVQRAAAAAAAGANFGAASGSGGSRRQNPRVLQDIPQRTRSWGWGFRVRVERVEVVWGGCGGWRVWGFRDFGERDDGESGREGEGVRCLLVGEGRGVVGFGSIVGISRGGLGWEVGVGDGVDVGREGAAGDEGTWWVGVGWESGGGGGSGG